MPEFRYELELKVQKYTATRMTQLKDLIRISKKSFFSIKLKGKKSVIDQVRSINIRIKKNGFSIKVKSKLQKFNFNSFIKKISFGKRNSFITNCFLLFAQFFFFNFCLPYKKNKRPFFPPL